MSAEREELAWIIMSPESFDGGPVSCGSNDIYAARIADAILAAGYSKPRTITTATELDALEAAADAIAQDDGGACECRRSSYDKHDINPPCSGRRRAVRAARAALEAAAPYLMAQAFDEGADFMSAGCWTETGSPGNPYRPAHE